MKLTHDSFAGGIYLRVNVRMNGLIVGELTRQPRTGWHDGPANTYLFHPNAIGVTAGLVSTSGETTIKRTLERAQRSRKVLEPATQAA